MEETKKLIPLMDKDELLEFVKDELNEAGITDTADIQREMETGVFGRNFSERGLQAYIRLLKIELAEATSERPRFMDSNMFGEYFAGKYAQLEFEELHLISLNGQLEITSDDLIASGTIDRAAFSMNKLFRIMCLNSQPSFMLVHNHPSGSLRPSTQDITTAQNVKKLAKIAGLDFLDNFIVADGKSLSFRSRDLI